MRRSFYLILSSLLFLSACIESQKKGVGGGVDVGNPAVPVDVGNPVQSDLAQFSLVSVNQNWADGFLAADLNGDHKVDMVVSGNPQVLLGKGDGTFSTGITFEPNSSIVSVQSGDFNKDGKVDLVYKEYLSPHVSVRFGNGDGTFGARADSRDSSTSAYRFSDIQVADVNEDGFDDIISINSQNSDSRIRDSITIRLNDGRGNFVLAASYFAPINMSESIRVGDLNGDGHLDLISQHSTARGTYTYMGSGTGSFGVARSTGYDTGGWTVELSNIREHGILDFVVQFGATIVLSSGNGDGTFAAPKYPKLTMGTYSTPVVGTERPALGDLDGDGRLDLVTANMSEGTVSIHQGRGDGMFESVLTLRDTPNAKTVKIADLDGDGVMDLIVKPSQTTNDLTKYPIFVFTNSFIKNSIRSFSTQQ